MTIERCERCRQPIGPHERCEPYTCPPDGRYVHSKCVGELCRELMGLLARVPDDVREQWDDWAAGEE